MIPKFYKGRKSLILSALTLNDAAFWGSDAFVGVIFALYIIQNIEGGSAIHVGLIFGLYRAVRALASIPIGRYLDENKGHIDEYYSLLSAGLLVGLTYMALFFSTDLWHIYIGIILIALGHALDINAWRILFYGNIPENSEGQVIGVYETVIQIIYGLAIIVAGFVGEIFGFEWTLFFAGVFTIFSSIILLTVHGKSKRI